MTNCYFKQFSSSTCKKSKRLIIDSFEFHPIRGEREKAILSQIFSDAALGNTLIAGIADSTKTIKGYLGLIALSVGERGLVFISSRTGKKFTAIPKKFWKNLQNKISIDMNIHDFRHLLGYVLINNNASIESVQRLLGHSSIAVTQRYSNQKEQMAAQAWDTFSNIVNK